MMMITPPCVCQICVDYRASDEPLHLEARTIKKVVVEEGNDSGGIKKKKKKKKKKVGESGDKSMEEQLEYIEEKKKIFTGYKKDLLALYRLGETEKEDETTAKLGEKFRTLYFTVLGLYVKLMNERNNFERTLQRKRDEATSAYEAIKLEYIQKRTELSQQETEADEIMARWSKFREEKRKPPKHATGEKRFSREERIFFKNQALFYQTLYDDIDRETQKKAELDENIEALAKKKNEYRTKKKNFKIACDDFRAETIRVSHNQSNFKTRNASIVANKGLINREEDMINVIDDEEAEEEQIAKEEEEDLSDTEESMLLDNQISRVRAMLESGDFLALRKKFSEPYQEYFLAPLIRMYKMNQADAIAQFSLDLILLLIDEHGSLITELAELLVVQPVDVTKIVTRLEGARITDLKRKLLTLVARTPNMSKLQLYDAIHRFINDDDSLFSNEIEVEEVDKPWISDTFIDPREELKIQTLFSSYDVIETTDLLSSHRSCVYQAIESETGQPVLIKIVPDSENRNLATEEKAYQLLGNMDGFAATKELFTISSFPHTVLRPCPRIKRAALNGHMHVYVTEYVPLSFHTAIDTLDNKEKLCVLIDILAALREAKLKYGIQHNQLTLENIRFVEEAITEDNPRIHTLSGRRIIKCFTTHHAKLIDFSMVSLESAMSGEERALLSGLDYESFYRLATQIPEMYVSDKVSKIMKDNLRSKGIPFDTLMDLIHDEMTK